MVSTGAMRHCKATRSAYYHVSLVMCLHQSDATWHHTNFYVIILHHRLQSTGSGIGSPPDLRVGEAASLFGDLLRSLDLLRRFWPACFATTTCRLLPPDAPPFTEAFASEPCPALLSGFALSLPPSALPFATGEVFGFTLLLVPANKLPLPELPELNEEDPCNLVQCTKQ